MCFSRPVPKAVQHIHNCYPSLADEKSQPQIPNGEFDRFSDSLAAPRNLSDLTFFAQIVPNRLPAIGTALLAIIQNDLKRCFYRRVRTGVLIFLGLLESLKGQPALSLFLEATVEAILILFKANQIHQKMFACELLSSVSSLVEDSAEFRRLVAPTRALLEFLSLSSPASGEENLCISYYFHAFQALSGCLKRVDFPFENSQFSFLVQVLVSKILQSPENPPAQGPLSWEAVDSAARNCIATMANSHKLCDLTSVLLVDFSSSGWSNFPRASAALALVANAQAGNGELIFMRIIESGVDGRAHNRENNEKIQRNPELELKSGDVELAVVGNSWKTESLKCAAQVAATLKFAPFNWQGVVDALVSELVHCASDRSPEALDEFAAAASLFLSSFSEKLPEPQDSLAALAHLVKRAATLRNPNPPLKAAILRLARGVSYSMAPFSSLVIAPDALVSNLTAAAACEGNKETRAIVYEILTQILTPPQPDSRKLLEKEDILLQGISSGSEKFQRFLRQINDKKIRTPSTKSGRAVALSAASRDSLLSLLHYELFGALPASRDFQAFASDSQASPVFQTFLAAIVNDAENWKIYWNFAISAFRSLKSQEQRSGREIEGSARVERFFLAFALWAARAFSQVDREASAGWLEVENIARAFIEKEEFTKPVAGVEIQQDGGLVAAKNEAVENSEALAAFPADFLSSILTSPVLNSLESFPSFSPSNLAVTGRPAPRLSVCFRISNGAERSQSVILNKPPLGEEERNSLSKRLDDGDFESETPKERIEESQNGSTAQENLDSFLNRIGGGEEIRKKIHQQEEKQCDELDEQEALADEEEEKSPPRNLLDFPYPRLGSFDFYLGAEMES